MKDRTFEELEKRIVELEGLIARKGVGSKYVERARRYQRNINIALLLGTATVVTGLAAWLSMNSDD